MCHIVIQPDLFYDRSKEWRKFVFRADGPEIAAGAASLELKTEGDKAVVDELWKKSATELAQLIKTKHVSSREVVESHLARIEAVNAKVNAITVVLAESALEAADAADRTPPSGPLHGVPFTIKENIDCVGSPTTQGVPLLAGPPLLYRAGGHCTPNLFTWIITGTRRRREAFTNFYRPALPAPNAAAEPDEYACTFSPECARYRLRRGDWLASTIFFSSRLHNKEMNFISLFLD